MTEIDITDPATLAAIIASPAVAFAWGEYQAIRQARKEGTFAGGPRAAEIAETTARAAWASAVREVAAA